MDDLVPGSRFNVQGWEKRHAVRELGVEHLNLAVMVSDLPWNEKKEMFFAQRRKGAA